VSRVLILGATGRVGKHLVMAGREAGHDLSVLVRDAKKFESAFGDDADDIEVIEGNVFDDDKLAQSMEGAEVAVNAALSIADGQRFVEGFRRIVGEAERRLSGPRRLWMFAGVAALDFPGTKVMAADLKLVPPMYRLHKTNFDIVRESDLNWSLMCPGPMSESPEGNGGSSKAGSLAVTMDEIPGHFPGYMRALPKSLWAVFLLRAVPNMEVPYGDVARLVMSELGAESEYSGKRVGIARPASL